MEYNCPKKCGKCCTQMYLPIYTDNQDVFNWVNNHEKCRMVEKDGMMQVLIELPCKYLVDSQCSIYDNRPEVCKVFKC